MPELPEVEAVARTLRPLVCGQTIVRCRVIHSIAARPQGPARLRRSVEGQRIEGVERRGKYLLLRLSRGFVALHFRLDGLLVWFDSPEAFSNRPRRAAGGHIDVAFELRRGTLGFVDRRHFGRVQWLAQMEDSRGIRGLGLDPFSRRFTPEKLQELLARARRPVKLLLMDQTRLAGLGNIYSNEALWHAQLDPRRDAAGLAPSEARRLHKSVVNVLRRALECCLHPAPDFRNPEWWFQGLEKMLRVYGRESRQCLRRCGGRIRRIEQGGRSSYFCASCQR